MKRVSTTAVAASLPTIWVRTGSAATKEVGLDKGAFKELADIAMRTAKTMGASYADIRVARYQNQSINSREERIESVSESTDSGFGVRVLWEGTWGFASSSRVNPDQIRDVTKAAIELARANRKLRLKPVEIETLTARDTEWIMPMKTDPFTVSLDKKTSKLLAINAAALKAGANFCSSSMSFVREEKFFASSFGSVIHQVRVRSFPRFNVTVVDKETGRFETRRSLAAPRGSGYEYVEGYDFLSEVATAVDEAKAKHKAKSVEPGKKDLVIHPTNLWLTIHESVGHPTELDRALGFEANFAGTSFVTPNKLGKLKYGSHLINIIGERTQSDGLATVAFDDDGVQSKGNEFHIIKNGQFENYQMAMGQAQYIGRKHSNACAFADSWDKYPLQRMPNISLQPGERKVSIEELCSEISDGIYILGDGSWSIDQQRYNFQFTGQVFYEIRGGKIGQMLRDVAYQGNTVDFWNACDGLCGKDEYHLGGAFNCGKGQPQQVAPVSHGAVPARFRQINVLNTRKS
jgi:TldD protein